MASTKLKLPLPLPNGVGVGTTMKQAKGKQKSNIRGFKINNEGNHFQSTVTILIPQPFNHGAITCDT